MSRHRPCELVQGALQALVNRSLSCLCSRQMQYARRGTNTTYTRTVKDIVIDATPDFEA